MKSPFRTHELVISPSGQVHCIYDEVIDLSALGSPVIARASHVEPDDEGRWWADLNPVEGPVLGPFTLRSIALEAEQEWLKDHWLANPGPQLPDDRH